MRRALLFLVGTCMASGLFAQIGFTDASDRLANTDFRSGAAMGVVDLNGDGLDDILRVRNNVGVVIDLQDPTGGSFQDLPTAASLSGSVWSVCAGDVNGDGRNDIGIGTFGQPTVLLSNASPFYQRELLSESIFAQGYNMVDLNADGMLDLFVCHDVGLSTPYQGDGAGAFVYNLDLFPAYADGDSDNSGNYGSLFTDYDNDGDLDMYMSRCRGGVSDPQDPRRMNNLYRNNGDGTYTDVAVEAGLRPFNQTWATDFADLDNDGDLDVVMVNHQAISRIYEQTAPGIFTDRTDETPISQIANWNGIQVFCDDFDNDTDLDIMLSASGGHYLLENQGDFNFDFSTALDFLTDNVHTAACGDLNNDGTLDLIAGFSNSLIGQGDTTDMLLLGVPNGNHHLRVRLEGHFSNANGIGARLELYGDWGLQIREMRAGESYGLMNSLTEHFGLADHTTIDSLVVRWPSGRESIIENPDIDQTLVVSELVINFVDTEAAICVGDGYQASNGETYQEPGTYLTDTTENADGSLSIDRLFLSVFPTFDLSLQTTACQGDELVLPDGTSIVAAEGFNDDFVLETQNGCDSIVAFSLEVIPLAVGSLDIHACPGQTITLPDGSLLEVQNSSQQTLTFESDNGNCDSLLEVSIIVPELDFELISNDSLGFTADIAAESYQWIDCDNELLIEGATSANFTPPYNGNFAVEVSVGGCVTTSACQPYLFSNVEAPLWAQELELYPNPTSGQLWLDLPNTVTGAIRIEVYTSLGQFRLAQVGHPANGPLSIQLAEQTGMYWLRIIDEQGRSVTRQVIIRP